MMTKLIKPIIALILMVLLSACGSDAQMVSLTDRGVILAFGDSLTAGNGAPANGSYPAQLSVLLNRNVINAGISGEESDAGLARLEALLDQHRPELMILCHGGNDFLRKRPVNQLESNLKEMIAMAQQRGIQILLLGVPRPGIFLSGDEVYEKIAEETGVPFIPELIADVLSRPAWKSDTVHPNQTGYSEIAGEIFAELQNLGAI